MWPWAYLRAYTDQTKDQKDGAYVICFTESHSKVYSLDSFPCFSRREQKRSSRIRLTRVSWHILGNQWGSHDTLLFVESEVWRSEYCQGMICRPVCTGREATWSIYPLKNPPKNMLSAIHLLSCTTYNIRMYRPSVGEWALRSILLHMHAKEAHVHAINLLKGKKCFGSVRKGLRHFTRVHKPVVTKTKNQIWEEVQHIWT